jgi:hypothetical protein
MVMNTKTTANYSGIFLTHRPPLLSVTHLAERSFAQVPDLSLGPAVVSQR